jgi:hypothetical protein
MRARLRLLGLTFLMCLTLCLSMVAFTGTASAHTNGYPKVNPHLTVNPNHVYSDNNGCATLNFTGKGFYPNNVAYITVHDPYDATYFADTGYNYEGVNTDAKGKFSVNLTVCGLYFKEKVKTVAVDGFTYLASNWTTFKAN